MKRNKTRSQVSVATVKSDVQCKEDIYIPPLDVLNIKVMSFHVPDEDPKQYDLKITFFDQLLLSAIVIPSSGREIAKGNILAVGQMNYDPSDYEKMGLFADNPLIVKIQPYDNVSYNVSGTMSSSVERSHSTDPTQSTNSFSNPMNLTGTVYGCNIDILPIFIDTDKLYVNKRMQPMVAPSVLNAKSWDNLPLITMTLKVDRNAANVNHHKILRKANSMKITLIAGYNMKVPFDDQYIYTAATKLPQCNEPGCSLVTYNRGYRAPKRFSPKHFYPHWENLRTGESILTEGNDKFSAKMDEFQNEENINLKYYLRKMPKHFTTVWASFHRTLMLPTSEQWLTMHLRNYKWPLEVHISGENCNYNFMAFFDLFRLLYPGENTARLVVPLLWIDAEAMMKNCGCEHLLASEEKAPSGVGTTQKPSKATTESVPTSTNTEATFIARQTGSDENNAFVILEVSLARPFIKPSIPPNICRSDIKDMLLEMELATSKRECTGRGQQNRDWQSTVQSASNSLHRIPYYGLTDFCTMDRQLSETRTRVELATSFWQDAAVYVNNNFVVKDFLQSKDTFEEMVMMSHACLMRITIETLTNPENRQEINPKLRAARQARQLQDISHATDLYLQVSVDKNKNNPDIWRELATCLNDVDKHWANACIVKSISLNPRHPLSLLSKGCMIFDQNPDEAEPFFVALLAFYPFWLPLWAAASAYYLYRQLYHMSQQIMQHIRKTLADGMAEDMNFPRTWERELGDWWDQTPLLPGTNIYYDAADLLLRIRGISLAEVCIARALSETGESPLYYHLVSLCCRLRGDVENALCHLKNGIEKFGELSYLKSLEGECQHKIQNIAAATTCFEKSVSCSGAYITLLSLPRRDPQRTRSVLVDLLRRHPSAYAWMALADYWMARSTMGEGGDACYTEDQVSATTYAVACSVQALKWDRQAGRAWALLCSLVKPSARRLYCQNMAAMCEYSLEQDRAESNAVSEQSLCYRLGNALRECRCMTCQGLRF